MFRVFEDDYEAAGGEVGRPSGRVHQDAGHQKFENLKKETLSQIFNKLFFITLKSALFYFSNSQNLRSIKNIKYNQRSNSADRDFPNLT